MSSIPAHSDPICLRRPALRPLCLRAAVARKVLQSVARRVPVEILLPDGTSIIPGHTPDPTLPALRINRPGDLFERLAHHPKIGIGEGYMHGDWEAAAGTDLADLLAPFAERMTTAVPPALMKARRLVDRRIPLAQRNSLEGSRDNIEAHYDLSNQLFENFLDPTMMYSSALFDDGLPWSEQPLLEAQIRKIDNILDMAEVGHGTRVLEIGTGWGTLAIEAARRGAHVTSITLSKEQAALARDRIDAAGLNDLIDVRLVDYREIDGTYDAVVSVEMIEAVGEEFWPTYFSRIDDLLAPGGKAAVQAILMDHDRYRATRNSYGWIQKHIFPGGLIPSLRAIRDVTGRHTDLSVTEVEAFGTHYGETLKRWRQEFTRNWPYIRTQGFDDIFYKKWEFYLAYCEAGFRTGYLDVAQIRMERS